MATIFFRALQLANEQRSTYGMRYNDYNRYRKHCANKVHRLRSTLKMTHGKGREFKKLPPLTQENIKEGHLQLLLVEAERAWAYSQELYASSEKAADSANASTLRHNSTGRFRRAIHWTTQLLSHCQSLYISKRFSAENLLQVTAYTLILNGQFLHFRDEFEDAVVQLSVARYLLDELASAATTSRDQALAIVFADLIGPQIRHSAHQLGRERSYDVDAIVNELANQHRNEIVEGCGELVVKLRTEGAKADSRKKLADLMWEGKPVPVRNPELVDALLKVQEAEAKLVGGGGRKVVDSEASKGSKSRRGVAAYDAILLALSDAEDIARKLMEAQQLNPGTSVLAAGTDGSRDVQFVHAYVVYQLLSRRIQRDLLLINALLSPGGSHGRNADARTSNREDGKVKPESAVDARLYPAVVKLLDTVLQSLTQMRTLSVVDESPDLVSAVETRISFSNARRCLFLARCYAPLKRFAEALTLTQRAHLHLREAQSIASTADSDPITTADSSFYPLSLSLDFDHFTEELAASEEQFKLDWFAHNEGSVDAERSSHKKLLFFDIALNSVQMDLERLKVRGGIAPKELPKIVSTSSARMEVKPIARAKAEEERRAATPEPEAEAPARGALGSLLGGWWGRK